MKQAYITFLFLFCLLSVVSAQQQLVKTVFQIGDTLYRAVDLLPENPKLARVNTQEVWDFTELKAPYVQEIFIRLSDRQIESHEEPTHCSFSMGKGTLYRVVNDDKEMWIDGIQIVKGRYKIQGYTDNKIPFRVSTSELGGENAYHGKVTFNLPTEIVAALENRELAFADSVRLIASWSYQLKNDAQGEIRLESGYFNAMRQKITKAVDVRVEIKQSNIWKTTDHTISIELPHELQSGITYAFWNVEVPEPLAVVFVDNLDNAIRVSFKARKNSGRRIVKVTPSKPDIFVDPNPSFGDVRFDMVNLPKGEYQLEIYSILGVRLKSFTFPVDGALTYPLNLTDMRKGTYIFRLVNEQGKTIRSKRLVIITP